MALRSVAISNFRCIESADLELDSKVSLIVGNNASGKTSLLEALFFLGRGRSFRTRRLEHLVRRGCEEFMVVGAVDSGVVATTLGVRGRGGGIEARLGGRPATSIGEMAVLFAPQIIDPEVHKLLEEGPARRRRFLDWGVFHVERAFIEAWQRYHRALKQRNAALKQGLQDRDVALWDPELISAGELLNAQRERYSQRLSFTVCGIGTELLGSDVTIELESGWELGSSYASALDRSREKDRRFRATQVGPHRADVRVKVAGMAAKDHVSRGQQKLLAAALVLAQLTMQESDLNAGSALLLDDPAAELDAGNLDRLMRAVSRLRSQIVVTSLKPEVPGLPTAGRVFHVEQGRVKLI
jgi:DNA replication and repair protein RecF